MDSNFQYASIVRWHQATDLPLPPFVEEERSESARADYRAMSRDTVSVHRQFETAKLFAIGERQIRYTTRPRPTRGHNTRGPYRDTREQTHGPARPPPPGAD